MFVFRASDSVAICESKKEKQEVRKLSFTNHSFESFRDFVLKNSWGGPEDKNGFVLWKAFDNAEVARELFVAWRRSSGGRRNAGAYDIWRSIIFFHLL